MFWGYFKPGVSTERLIYAQKATNQEYSNTRARVNDKATKRLTNYKCTV